MTLASLLQPIDQDSVDHFSKIGERLKFSIGELAGGHGIETDYFFIITSVSTSSFREKLFRLVSQGLRKSSHSPSLLSWLGAEVGEIYRIHVC